MSFHWIIQFGYFVDSIYAIELEIKDTVDTAGTASYFDLHIEIDSEDRLRTKLYKRWFQFLIVNFSFICNNILQAPTFGAYKQFSWYDVDLRNVVFRPHNIDLW